MTSPGCDFIRTRKGQDTGQQEAPAPFEKKISIEGRGGGLQAAVLRAKWLERKTSAWRPNPRPLTVVTK